METLSQIAVIVPAYQPDHVLLELLEELRAQGFCKLVVVDDGSPASSAPIFDALADKGCVLVRHTTNLGKGRALKTGMNEVGLRWPQVTGLITVDADGQHRAGDAARVAQRQIESGNALVLGARMFDTDVPWRSMLGNRLTSLLFRFLAGSYVTDTQTGLRAFPSAVLPRMLRTPGERYEFELNTLMAAKGWGLRIVEVPIETVYVEQNRGSHFRPIIDSLAIYGVLMRFASSSLSCSLLDYLLFAAMYWQTGAVSASMLAGRLASSAVNLLLNREFVFKAQHGSRLVARQIFSYYALVAFLGTLAYGMIRFGHEQIGLSILVSKVLSEAMLFAVSFAVQREFVFAEPRRATLLRQPAE